MNNKIGISNESSLHKYLKYQYSGDTGETEITVGDYVCDGQTKDGELIEVQTGSFGPLKEKIKKLSPKNKIRIIYPVIKVKIIEVYDAQDNFLRKRKSRIKGGAWDIFDALVYAPEIACTPRVIIELAFLDIIEKRKDDGKGSWRRKGITIEDKTPDLAAINSTGYESIILKKPKDYFRFLPFEGDEHFTVSDLAEKAGISIDLAGKCLYVLNKMGLISRIGKKVNAYVYAINAVTKKSSKKKGGKPVPSARKSLS